MDIVKRLLANADAQEAGPYVSLKENREAQRTAAYEIEYLREENERLQGQVNSLCYKRRKLINGE